MKRELRTAAIYCRISQDRDDKREGVKRQEADCRDLADELGWEVAGVYVDNDVSASSGRPRPQWKRMIADIESGRVNAVLAWHPDRLIRRPAELEDFIDLAERHKTAINTCKAGDYDLSTASGKMVARMLGAAARHETDRMSERIRAVKASKAQDGLWKGGSRPFGYRSTSGPKGEPGYLAVIEEEAEVLRELVDKFLAGASLRSLAQELQRRGVLRTKGDSNWTTGDVGRMIGRPVSAGLVMFQGEPLIDKNTGSSIAGVWEPIVERDKWLAASTILKDPARRTNRGRQRRHLLSGIATCGGTLTDGSTCCGSIMANAGDYYRCGSGRDGRIRPEGNHVYRKRSDLDAYARELVIARLSRPDATRLLMPSHDNGDDPERLASQVDAVRKRQADLAEMFADGEITRAQFSTASKTLKTDLEDLEGRLAVAVNSTPHPVIPELDRASRAEEVWDGLSPERQREVIRALMRLAIMPSDRRGRNPFKTSDIQVEWLA